MRALERLEVHQAPKGPAEQFIVYGGAIMRVLITGGAGFISRRVLDNGWTPSRERPRRGP